MFTLRKIVGLAAILIGIGWTQAKALDSIPADELKRLHVLLVVDSDSNLRESVVRDSKNVRNSLISVMGDTYSKRVKIEEINGKNVTLATIQNKLKTMEIAPEDGVLFMYFGHGQYDKKLKEHYFTAQTGYNGNRAPVEIKRSDVVEAIQGYNPGLVVLMTDCCSSYKTNLGKRDLGTEKEPVASLGPKDVKPRLLAQSLFFKARGLVNITAAQMGEPAWSDSNGGFFTVALTNSLKWQYANELNWEQFFNFVQKQTQLRFQQIQSRVLERRAETRDDGELELLKAKPQQPWKMDIKTKPAEIAKNSKPEENSKSVKPEAKPKFGAILIINRSKEEAEFTFRRPGETEDQVRKVEADGKFFEVFSIPAQQTDAKISLGIKTNSLNMPAREIPVEIFTDRKPDESEVKKKFLRPVKS